MLKVFSIINKKHLINKRKKHLRDFELPICSRHQNNRDNITIVLTYSLVQKDRRSICTNKTNKMALRVLLRSGLAAPKGPLKA